MTPPWPSFHFGAGTLAGAVIPVMAALAQAVQAIPRQQDFLLRSDTNLVVLDVSVTHSDGSPISGLTREHFRISEGGRTQTIKFHSAGDSEVTVGLVLDISGSMHQKIAWLQRSVSTLMSVSNPGDDYFVVGFNDSPRFPLPGNAPFTSSPDVILSAIRSLRAEGRTTLYDGLIAALRHIVNSKHERRVLVLVSDGKDTASSARFDELLELVRSSAVTIYAIGLFEDGGQDRDEAVLKRLARISGGRFARPSRTDELDETCRRVANDIRARYILAYTPPELPKCGVRKISVQVMAPEARPQVQSRREYTLNRFDPSCR